MNPHGNLTNKDLVVIACDLTRKCDVERTDEIHRWVMKTDMQMLERCAQESRKGADRDYATTNVISTIQAQEPHSPFCL